MFFKPNRLVHLTPEEQKRRDAAQRRARTQSDRRADADIRKDRQREREKARFLKDSPVSAVGKGGRDTREEAAFAESLKPPEPTTEIDSAIGLADGTAEPTPQDNINRLGQEIEDIVGETPMQRRTRIADSAAQAKKQFGLGSGNVPTSQADIQQQKATEDRARTAFSQQNESRIRELEGLGLSRAAESGRRGAAAAASAFRTGTGAVSSAQQALPAAFQAGGQRILNEAKLRINAARAQRSELERRRKSAVEANNRSLISELDREIQNTKLKEKQAQLAAEQGFAGLDESVRERQDLKVATFLDAEGALSGMDDATLTNLAEGSSFSFADLDSLRNVDIKAAEISKIKNDEEREAAKLSNDEKRAKILSDAEEKPSEIEQFSSAMDRLVANKTLSREDADKAIQEELGIRADEAKPVSELDQLKAEEIELKNRRERLEQKEEFADAVDTDATGERYSSMVSGTGNAGVVTQDFGATSPVEGDNRELLAMDGSKKTGTPGVDLDGAIGDPVLASISGVTVDAKNILSVGDFKGLGNIVAVQDFENNVHFFNHLSAQDVPVGENITKGQQLGQVGKTGNVIATAGGDGSHLDYRVQDAQGNWIDPRQFISEFAAGAKAQSISEELQARVDRANVGETPSKVKENQNIIKRAIKSGDQARINETIDELERKKFLSRSAPIVTQFNKGIKDFKEVKDKSAKMETAFNFFVESGKENATFVDQALISLFNKITDPQSVVRESEFERTGQSLGFSDRFLGKVSKQLIGGAGLTNDTRQAAIDISRALVEGAEANFDTALGSAKQQAIPAGVPEDFLLKSLGLTDTGELPGQEKFDLESEADAARQKSEVETKHSDINF